eukprot:gene14734-31314_t
MIGLLAAQHNNNSNSRSHSRSHHDKNRNRDTNGNRRRHTGTDIERGSNNIVRGTGSGTGNGNGSHNNDCIHTLPQFQAITMTDHIRDIVYRVQGYRPSSTASFGTIAIDSLAAVIFVRALSESIDNFKIETSKIFTPGVTIKSLAEELYQQLEGKRPDILDQLNIISPSSYSSYAYSRNECVSNENIIRGDTTTTTTINPIRNRSTHKQIEVENGDDVEDEDSINTDVISEKFDAAILSNAKLIEGLRGVLVIMVLWDHFHHGMLNDIWRSDTTLFVLLSGFTTSIQLRHSRIIKSIYDINKLWNWQSFLFTRAVGIFPVLWLALLLNAPRWYYHDRYYLEHDSYSSSSNIPDDDTGRRRSGIEGEEGRRVPQTKDIIPEKKKDVKVSNTDKIMSFLLALWENNLSLKPFLVVTLIWSVLLAELFLLLKCSWNFFGFFFG